MSAPRAGLFGALGSIPTFEALRYREFRLLWLGWGGTGMALWMDQVSRGWLMYQLTDSALQLGLVRLIQALPFLLMSPIAGALADRYDRKMQMVWAQALDGTQYLLLTGLIFTGQVAPWHVYATAFASAAVQAFQQPPRQSLVSESVPAANLTNAIGLTSIAWNVSRSLGPALAGALIAAWGTGAAFLGQAALLAAATVWVLQLQPALRFQDGTSRPRRPSFLAANVEALRFIRRSETVRTGMLVLMLASLLAMPFVTLLPVFARDILEAGPNGQGFLLSAMGIGALTSAVLIASFGDRLPKGVLMLLGAIVYGFTLVGLALTSWFVVFAGLMVVAGLCNVACNALIQTIVQANTPSELRGRIMAVYQQNQVVLTVGSMLAGALATAWGAQQALGSMGLACAVAALAIFALIPHARAIR